MTYIQSLTALDDTLRHMAPSTMNQLAVTDHRFFDRYWYGTCAPDGSIALVTGLGSYANMNVLDGYFCVILDGNDQRNLRVSRKLRPDIDRIGAGPLDYATIEAHQRNRITLVGNDGPARAELEFTATEDARLELPHRTLVEGHLVEDYLRITQIGKLSGTIDVGDRHWEVDEWFCGKDHSWGVRKYAGGVFPVTGAPSVDDFSGLFLWAAWRSGPYQGYVQIQEDGHGNRRFSEGDIRITDGDGERTVRIVDVDLELAFIGNSNLYQRADLVLTTDSEERFEVTLKPAHTAFGMVGTGYFDGFTDGQGFGVYRGDDIQEADRYALHSNGDVEFPDGRRGRPWHRELLVHATCNGVKGIGYAPILVEGEIPRYGLDLPARSHQGNGINYQTPEPALT